MDETNNELIDMFQKSTQLKQYQGNLAKTAYLLHTQQLIF